MGRSDADERTAALLAQAWAAGPCRAEPVLSHGDLYSRHLLIDAAGAPAAVIDWGDLCVAPPAVDLAVAWSTFGGTARAALLEAYGPVGDDTILRARTMALFSSAAVALYAHDVGDEALLSFAIRTLDDV